MTAYSVIDRWLDRMIEQGRITETPTIPVRRRDVSDLARDIIEELTFTEEETTAFHAVLDGYTFHRCDCKDNPHPGEAHDGWGPEEELALDSFGDKVNLLTEKPR